MSRNRKWHIFILSFLFSILLWASVNLGGKYQSFIRINVVPTNIPKGKSLVDQIPQTVNVKFDGPGWKLASIYFNPNIKLELDLSKLNNGNYISLKQNLNEFVKVPSDVRTIDVEPEGVKIEIDDYIEKKVPVKSNLNIFCLDGYGMIGNIICNPDSILLGGSKKSLKDINFWLTEYQEFNNVKHDIVTLLPLKDTLPQIFKLSNTMIGIEANIQMLAEQKFSEIDIVVTEIPPKTFVNIIPPKIDITVRSGVEKIAGINRLEILAKISYKKLVEDTTGLIIPEITLPEGLRLIGIEPANFEYVIRKSQIK